MRLTARCGKEAAGLFAAFTSGQICVTIFVKEGIHP